ncbi:efflux transporter outer membrane subunit [Collimonas pratensis]|uniref:efflux transporter outer membrane subunit n=1 Tax=Collimonas pratensis TaxID=279113 RepID=UPI001F10AECB|nr:efflux transporter outer membrane subunit [Collimonas pratensis]
MHYIFQRSRSLASTCSSAVLLLLLSACASQIEMREATPSVEIPQSWDLSANTGEQDWPDTGWWQRFGSDELSQLVAQGQASNLEIAAAVSRVRQAEAQARIAGAPLLPNADFSTSINRAVPLAANGSAVTSTSGLLEIGYEVDFWGKNRAGLVAAEASLQANRYDRETVALTVTSGIVSTYLQVLSLRDRIEIAQHNVDNAERVLKLVSAQSRAGSASPLDLARQRSAVAGQQAVIPDLKQQEREAQTALAILLGRPPQTFTVNEPGLAKILLPQVTPGLPSELLSRRPDIRHAEAELASANANVAVARAALFPSIRLTGSAGGQSNALLSLFNGPNMLANLGAGLVAPIFDAGRLNSQRDLAVAQKQELVQIYRSTVISALSEVDTALGQIRSLDEQRKLKVTEMEQARFAFELSEIRYRVGAEDLMTVLDTQRSLSEVQNELGQIKLKRLKATVSLYKALGGGWQDVHANQPAAAPAAAGKPAPDKQAE